MGQNASHMQDASGDAAATAANGGGSGGPWQENKPQLWRPTAAAVQRGIFTAAEYAVDSSLEAKTLQACSPPNRRTPGICLQ